MDQVVSKHPRGVAIAIFRDVIKGESGNGKPEELISNRLADNGASLNVPNKGTKSPSLALVNLKYLGKRTGLTLRVPMWGKAREPTKVIPSSWLPVAILD